MQQVRDVLIIGSGPAGYTAAIYAARANLKPLLFQGLQPGGQLTITTDVENYPGYADGVLGPKMMEDFQKQAERFGTEIKFEEVVEVGFGERPFRVKTDTDTYHARAVILATGASAKLLGLDSEAELMGHGVSACATCDGAFFKGKHVLVVGGGDTAMEEATYLSGLARSVTLVHRRDEFRASKIMLDRARHNPKIKFMTNTVVEDLYDPSKQMVTAARLRNTKTGVVWDQEVDGFFLAIGHIPNTKVFKGQIETDPDGYILSKGGARTNIAGVFHAGDVQDRVYRQAITASGAGCMAAIEVEKFLEAEGH
jgi:thioredoxin reductase (NADPH)